ncbi:OpgC domain-containing protein [Methylobacterium sp. 77]|uniref:OpgC domain-containing protein n=1 Tax=Methylobacterium sp. 77 TaxID=1101192 RepID=UPI00037F75CC|nr:OpgC domain-containing protein [Methylobacterium sp. 77]
MIARRTTIDAIRGLCLVNIFVNHLEGGHFSQISPSRLGFSDSSEIFVLLSGISTALAYSNNSDTAPFSSLVRTLWLRALRLHAFNIALVLATLAVLNLALEMLGPAGVTSGDAALLAEHGSWTMFWHAVTFRQNVGYSCVLRLYVVLMLLAPVFVRLAEWRWWAPIPPALVTWAAAGHFDLVIPNSLSGQPFTLTVLPWTLLFATGVAIGRAMKLDMPLPYNGLALALALANLAGYLIFATWVVRISPSALEWAESRNTSFWFGASKTYQSPLRVLHVLTLAYVVAAMPRAPLIRLLHQMRPDHPLCRLGRNSIVVFTIGAVASVAASETLHIASIVLADALLVKIAIEIVLIGAFIRLALCMSPRPTSSRSNAVADAVA